MAMALHIIVGLVAFLHIYFLWFEMFQWETKGPQIFRKFPKELFKPTKEMAANQGLYNGFLAAGLIWTYFITDLNWQLNLRLFFLICVLIAGLFGALTVSKKIFLVQGVPALLGVLIVILLKYAE